MQGLLHDPGVDDRGPGLGVDLMNPVQMPRNIDHQPLPDGVSCTGGARAPDRHGNMTCECRTHQCDEVLAGLGAGDGLRRNAIERCVRRIESTGQGRVINEVGEVTELMSYALDGVHGPSS